MSLSVPASTVARTLRALCCALACGCAAPPPPNVLLVSIDSLRADHVHAAGYARETTPVIDRLAAEGARFDAAIAASSWTLPTHVTLLTALPPEIHGVTSSTRALADDALTLAEVLRARGYRTAAVVSGPYLRALYGFAQGFDVYDESVVASGHLASHHGATSPALVARVDGLLTDWAGMAPRPPLFLFLHMWDVHFDYDPPPPYDTLFDPDYRGSLTGKNFVQNRAIRPDMPRRDLEHLIALYDGEIRYTDEHLGRIVDRLAALGARDETVIVVTADHGEEFFEHGRKGHDARLYDELLRVPLVIRFPPRVAPNQVVRAQVRQMDIAPTILGLLGIAPPAGFGGPAPVAVDLSPWITGARRDPAGLPPFAYAWTAAYDGSGRHALGAVRTARAKYIQPLDAAPHRAGGGAPPPELYDLAVDPRERTNMVGRPALVARHGPRAEPLRSTLDRWLAAARRVPAPSHEIEIDPALRLRLLQLGYLE